MAFPVMSVCHVLWVVARAQPCPPSHVPVAIRAVISHRLDKSISLACFPLTYFIPLCGVVLPCHEAKGTPGITSALFQQTSQHPCLGAP